MITETKTKKVNFEKAYNELLEKIESQIKNTETTHAFHKKQAELINSEKETYIEKSQLLKLLKDGELLNDMFNNLLGRRSTI